MKIPKGPLIDRRKLLSLAGTGFAASALNSILGCGGSGVNSGNSIGGVGTRATGGIDGGGTIGRSITEAERISAIQSIEARAKELAGIGTQFDVVQMLSFMQSLKRFIQVGFHSKSGTVWGIYTDGVLHAVLNNVDFSAAVERSRTGRSDRSRSRPARRDSENKILIAANQWRQMHLFDSLPSLEYPHITDVTLEGDQLRDLAEAVQTLGMNVVAANVGQPNYDPASLDQLRNVAGDGVFFYTGFGAKSPWTSSLCPCLRPPHRSFATTR